MNMGDRIKEMRKKRGFTQEELAQKLGLKDSAIAKYESGRVENIKRSVIAEIYLLCLDESPAEPVQPVSDFQLSELEKTIILEYRRADNIDKEMVLRVLRIEEKRDDAKMA